MAGALKVLLEPSNIRRVVSHEANLIRFSVVQLDNEIIVRLGRTGDAIKSARARRGASSWGWSANPASNQSNNFRFLLFHGGPSGDAKEVGQRPAEETCAARTAIIYPGTDVNINLGLNFRALKHPRRGSRAEYGRVRNKC